MDKLAKLNELVVVDSSCHDECCEYVLIENSEENREVLKELGADEHDIRNMDPYGDGMFLDITRFVFEDLGAGWFESDEGFSYDEH